MKENSRLQSDSTSMHTTVIQMDPIDNVYVATKPFKQNDIAFDGQVEITIGDEVPMGHKLAKCAIHKGEAVIKYGVKIGIASLYIKKGCHVHTQNVRDIEYNVE